MQIYNNYKKKMSMSNPKNFLRHRHFHKYLCFNMSKNY